MRSIERRYNKITRKNLLTGTPYGNLRLAVLGMKFKPRTISSFFDSVMRPEDYAGKERFMLLDDLNRATNQYVPRTDKNKGKTPLGAVEND